MRQTPPLMTVTHAAATWLRTSWIAALVGTTALMTFSGAHSATSLCSNGAECVNPLLTQSRELSAQQISLTRSVLALTGVETAAPNAQLSDQEYLSFSGVGAVVCTVGGVEHMSTAFLVGAFDIGVTVAHTFEQDGAWALPQDCVYTSTDSVGQIRERIPVSYIKAQWAAEDGAFGQPAKDFAVIRLSQPSRFAQRTMPLGKFSGAAASVLMIGFNTDLHGDTVKRKTQGMVYERKANGVAISSMAGFTHDMDSRDIASGAPVIDATSGVIIGVHTQWTQAKKDARPTVRNTMIAMNDWLERTLRMEMMAGRTAAAEHESR